MQEIFPGPAFDTSEQTRYARLLNQSIALCVQLIGLDSKPLKLKCINWLGFNTGQTMLNGLLAGTTALSQDYSNIAYRIQVCCSRILQHGAMMTLRLRSSYAGMPSAGLVGWPQSSKTAV